MKQLKRSFLKLLMLFVGLFALSPIYGAAPQLYLYGKLGNYGVDFAANNAISLPKTSNGVFSIGPVTVTSNSNFKLSEYKANDNDKGGWDYVNSGCFGPNNASSSTTVKEGSNSMEWANSNDWVLPAGTWTLSIDTNSMTMTATKADEGSGKLTMLYYDGKDKSLDMTQLADGSYTCDLEYKGGELYFCFDLYNTSNTSIKSRYGDPKKNGTGVGIGTHNLGSYSSSDDCKYLYNGTTGTLTFTVSKDFKTVTISVKSALRPDLAGKYFLLGQWLNDYYESPAWELEPTSSSNIFTMDEFAYRPNDNGNSFQVAYYDNTGKRTVKNVTLASNSFTKSYDNSRKPGWLVTASYNSTSNTLTFTQKGSPNVLPYVGVLGKNFRQQRPLGAKEGYTTRHQYIGANSKEKLMGNTDYGWQEAYIEYDEFGQPILDEDGVAYYNTVWPPRNNILMESYLGEDVDPLLVSSDDLTLHRDSRGVMTGSQWTTTLQAENKTEYKTSYSGAAGFNLQPGVKYARYYVENVWMMGEYKIWTGWGGKKQGTDDWGAYWDSHTFFGPGNDDFNQKLHDGYYIYKDASNFYTKPTGYGTNNKPNKFAREYYRTMELFLPVYNDNEDDYYYMEENNNKHQSVFYLTESDGGAQIDALARQNKYVGYAPSITNIPDGYKLTGYKITRYKYESGVAKDKLSPIMADGSEPAKDSDAIVKQATGLNITTVAGFNNLFSMDNSIFSGNYVNDGEYAIGSYIFKLEVTFSNGIDTKSTPVWSPRVEIVAANGTVSVNAYQLIDITGVSDSQFSGYNYLAYKSGTTPVLVNAANDNSISDFKVYDGTNDALQQVYSKTGVWTNKAFIAVSDPAAFVGTKNTFNVKEGTTLIKDLKGATKLNNRYVMIRDNSTTLNTKTYNVTFSGNTAASGNSESVTVTSNPSTTYQPTFMKPAFVNNSAKLFFDADPKKLEGTYTASHDDLHSPDDTEETNQQAGITTARHELRAEVALSMPNVLPAIRTAVYDALNVNLQAYTSDEDASSATVYTSKATPGAAAYKINYRYQNPLDWFYEVTPGSGIWKGYERVWNLSQSNYSGTNVNVRAKDHQLEDMPSTITYTAQPKFYAPIPTANAEHVAEYYVATNAINNNNDWQVDLYLRKLNITTDKADDFYPSTGNATLTTFTQENNNLAMLVKVEAPAAPVQFNPFSKVGMFSELTSYSGESVEGDDESDTYDHKIASFKIPIDHGNYDHSKGEYGDDIKALNATLDAMDIKVAYAYYFSAGDTMGDDGTTEHKSTMDGFSTANVPAIRYDHAAVTYRGLRAQLSGDNDGDGTDYSGTLATGDNAFLFAPVYLPVKSADQTFAQAGGQLTGIKDVEGNVLANIITGKGFIDLNGNAGMIFTADGRTVYNGNSRANLQQGVYVVTLKNRSVKVLVK